MTDYILTAVIVLAIAAAVISLIRRRGHSGCCGSGSDYRPRKKKLKHVIATKVFTIEGMHCEKCSSRITGILNDIPGVAGVVSHKKGTAVVSYEREVPDEEIREKIQRFGYRVTDIR